MAAPETARARDVLIVCNNHEELGGLQTWAHHLSRLLAARGHTVTLVGIHHVADPHDHGDDASYERVTLYPGKPPAPWTPSGIAGRADLAARRRERRRVADRADAVERLSALFRAARPGGVVIAAQVWAMEWVAEADTAGLPVIGMSHESYAATRTSSRYRRVKRYFAEADRFLVLTEDDAAAWSRDGMTNTGWMPNPLHVEPEGLAELAAPVVARLGRLAYEKGQDMLLDAWDHAREGRPGWTLRLFGSGPAEAALRKQAAGAGFGASVDFAGPTSDIGGALRGASVFALTSREEGFPMAILEAMAHGVPVVAFDCAPGVRELVTDGVDGCVVPAGHVVEFAAALGRLMDDPELRRKMGRAAQESTRRFAPATVVAQWERLFALLYR
ncbi:glycosyltransferase [Actinomadura parmotrematis]|uniref:Glycosyltransferase n=1 Tax=Actinomadura parmotrematis TaxID=2864039 RepID=A0ABS7G3P9_9ACTN|nr:glycosyltransferase [Actinomadura parmotrematis]MBW8486985.1 glycosyltransferase [Actinomadura parmotrematis]